MLVSRRCAAWQSQLRADCVSSREKLMGDDLSVFSRDEAGIETSLFILCLALDKEK